MARACRILLVLALAACGSGKPSGAGDMAADMSRDGSAVCNADAGGPTTATKCGSSTCPAGMICLVITPGIPPDDAGVGPSYSCVAVPSACGCAPGCSIPAGPAGCFSSLCIGGEQCAFDGATLTCFGI